MSEIENKVLSEDEFYKLTKNHYTVRVQFDKEDNEEDKYIIVDYIELEDGIQFLIPYKNREPYMDIAKNENKVKSLIWEYLQEQYKNGNFYDKYIIEVTIN